MLCQRHAGDTLCYFSCCVCSRSGSSNRPGTGVITGNTVCDANQKNFAACCLSGPACLLVQVSLSVIGTQFFRDFVHDEVNSTGILFPLTTTWQRKSRSLFDRLTVTPASIQIKAGGETKAAGVWVQWHNDVDLWQWTGRRIPRVRL